MKTPASLIPTDWKALAVVGGFILAAYYVITRDAVAAGSAVAGAAGDALKATGTAVNPLDSKNVANKTVTAIGQAFNPDAKNWTLGGQVFDWVNGTDTVNGNYHTTLNTSKKAQADARTAGYGVTKWSR